MGKYLVLFFMVTMAVVAFGIAAFDVVAHIMDAPSGKLFYEIQLGVMYLLAIGSFSVFILMISYFELQDIKEKRKDIQKREIEQEKPEPRKKIYTLYRTNKPNLLGGFMTYDTLDKAWDAVERGEGTQIIAMTFVDSEWWNGEKTSYLSECLSSGVIYRKK